MQDYNDKIKWLEEKLTNLIEEVDKLVNINEER